MPASRSILLVEDDPSTRALMEVWLETEGYDVRTASNGKEALILLREEAPCLMVVDLNMPLMDGVELRRQQLRTPTLSAVPFILVSAAHEAVRIAKELGVDVLAKPFDAERLLSIIGSHCHRMR